MLKDQAKKNSHPKILRKQQCYLVLYLYNEIFIMLGMVAEEVSHHGSALALIKKKRTDQMALILCVRIPHEAHSHWAVDVYACMMRQRLYI